MTDCYCNMDPCPCYGQGYNHGKDKAYFEIEHWVPGDHGEDCGCRPCVAARQITGKLSLAPSKYVKAEAVPVHSSSQSCLESKGSAAAAIPVRQPF